jgi:hypothetical protein
VSAPFDAERFAVGAVREQYFTEEKLSYLEARIVALEEIAAARWPRRLVLLGRLGRELRTKTARYAYAGDGFARRRNEQVYIDEEGVTPVGRALWAAS